MHDRVAWNILDAACLAPHAMFKQGQGGAAAMPCYCGAQTAREELGGRAPAVVWTSMMACRPSFAADFSRYARSVFGSTAAMSRAASAPIARACAPSGQ